MILCIKFIMTEPATLLPASERALGASSGDGKVASGHAHSAPSHSTHAIAHEGGRAGRAKAARAPFDPGFSFLRASLAARLGIVAVCVGVLWAAVLAVTA